MLRRALTLLLVAAALVACGAPAALPTAPPATATPAPPPTATPLPAGIVVDAGQRLGPISPLLFGSNIGPWTGVPLDTRDEVQAAGLGLLRFPGGNWGDENDLRDYTLDPFMALCRELGAEPLISVRLLGSTPAQAAAVVRFVNGERGYGVRYWSIGNEPSLYATSRRVEGYGVERFNAEWRAFAEAMREADPAIKLVGPDIHQFDAQGGPRDPQGNRWMEGFLRANGDMVDVVAFHRYPFPTSREDPQPSVDELYASSPEWDTLIPALRAIISETTGRELPVAVTEVNANWTGAARGDATPDSLAGAIWWADVLARLIRERVEMAAHFAIHGPGRQGWGLVEKYKVRPAYHVYTLFGRLGREQVFAATDDDLVTAVAALREDGALTVALVSRATEARALPLTIAGFAPGASAELYRLDAEHAGEALAPLPLTSGVSLELPPESVTVLVIPARQ
jgi:hypothetical protein